MEKNNKDNQIKIDNNMAGKIVAIIKKNKLYVIAMILMVIPIFLAIIAPMAAISVERGVDSVNIGGAVGGVLNGISNFAFGQRTEMVTEMVRSPFRFNGFASIFAVALYSILLFRNRNTLKQFNSDNIDIRIMILHILNILFLVTICSLFTQSTLIFGLSTAHFMIAATLLSLISMRSLSGYCWILAVVAAIPNLDLFNRWEGFSTVYVLCAYASIIVQILALNIFEFDLELLKQDFIKPVNNIKGDVQSSIATTMKAASSISAGLVGSISKAGKLSNDNNNK